MANKEQNWIERHPVWTVIITFFVICYVLVMVGIFLPEDSSKSVNVGEEGRLYQEGFDNVAVCSSWYYLDKMIDAANTNDKIGWNQLFSGKYYKRCYLVPKNTRVLVLDTTFGTTKFRILEGDYYAEVAWTNMEYIKWEEQ